MVGFIVSAVMHTMLHPGVVIDAGVVVIQAGAIERSLALSELL